MKREFKPILPSAPPGQLEEAQFWQRNYGCNAWDLKQGFPAWRPGDPKELFFAAAVTIKRIYDNGDFKEWDFKKRVEEIRIAARAREVGLPVEKNSYSYKDLHHEPVKPFQDTDKDDEFESLNTETHEAAVEIPVEGETEMVFA